MFSLERALGSPNNSSDYTNRGFGLFGPIGMKFSGEKLENVPYGIKKKLSNLI